MALILTVFALMRAPTASAASNIITVSGDQRFQTIDGFGVSINAHSWNNGELKPALDMLVDQNGSRIFRVVMEMTDWEQTNDNTDPNSYNWAYYNPIYSGTEFENVWSTIGYLRQKGIPSSNIILSFMGIGPTWMGGASVSSAQEDEWVEEVVSAAYYGLAVRGAGFGVFSPNNEPDWGHNEGVTMSATQYARVMNKVAQRLDSMGLSAIRLVGPETASVCSGTGEYWQQMTAYPTLMSKVDHISLHNYSGDACNASASVEASAYPGKSLWMTEFSIYDQAQSFLEQNATGLLVWDGYDSVYRHAILNGLGDSPGNDAGNAPALLSYNADTKTYTPRKEFYLFSQLFKYVPPGAVRVGASSSTSAVRVLAFSAAASGRITVVGNNTSSSSQTLTIALNALGTNPTALQYFQTNASSNMTQGADVAVSGGFAEVTVPAGTVFTLTGIPSTSADTTPPSVSIASPLAGTTVSGTVSVAATATDSVGVSAVQFTLDGANLASEDTTAPYSVNWDTTATTNGTHTITATARDAAGNVSTSDNTVVTVSNGASGSETFLMGNQTVQPYADHNAAGSAEGFRYVAEATGQASRLSLYIDSGSTASRVDLGIYSDDNNHPGTLLASSTISAVRAVEWNTTLLNTTAILTKGTAYWIGFIGTGGTLNYRDQSTGNCSESTSSNSITALPTTWNSGSSWPTCGLSAYVTGGASASDTSPPTAPANLALTGTTETSLSVSWSPSTDNVVVTGYGYYIDSQPLGPTTSDTSATLSNLTCQTSYAVAVDAYDAAGNRSQRVAITATTAPCADSTPPSATITSPLPGATVSGIVYLAATAADDVGVSAVQFELDGANLGSEDVTPPYTVGWDTTSSSNGTHTLTAKARNAAGNITTSRSVVVTVSNSAARRVTLDKGATTHQSSSSSSISAPALTTAQANELLVAFITSDGPRVGVQSISGVTGGGLTWNLSKRVNSQSGTAEIWTAAASSVLSNATVEATRAVGSYVGSITVAAFINANTSTIGAVAGSSGADGAPTTTLTATKGGSVVWGVGNDWDKATARTIGSGQTMVDQYLASVGDTYWVQRLDNATIAGHVVTISDAGPTDDQWDLAAIEILPSD